MKRPIGLTIIGALFILVGASALFELVQDLMHRRISLNFAVLMIPVGIGLLKGRASSRSWAKFWIGLFLLVVTTFAIAYWVVPERFHVSLGSEEAHGMMRHVIAVTIPALLIVAGVSCWKYLSNQKLDAFFDVKSAL